jgi:hypothetical protein
VAEIVNITEGKPPVLQPENPQLFYCAAGKYMQYLYGRALRPEETGRLHNAFRHSLGTKQELCAKLELCGEAEVPAEQEPAMAHAHDDRVGIGNFDGWKEVLTEVENVSAVPPASPESPISPPPVPSAPPVSPVSPVSPPVSPPAPSAPPVSPGSPLTPESCQAAAGGGVVAAAGVLHYGLT